MNSDQLPLDNYDFIWDVNIVLEYLKNIDGDDVSLGVLTHKLAMSLALTTKQRVQLYIPYVLMTLIFVIRTFIFL